MYRIKSALGIIFTLVIMSTGCIKVNNPAENQGPAMLSEINTATAVSAEGQPLAVASTFLASTPTIYVTAKVSNAPANTSVGARWLYVKDEAGQVLNQLLSEGTNTAKGTQYVSFSQQAGTGTWGSGQYSVSLSLNGKEVAVTQFSVKAMQTAGAQAPTISYFTAVPDSIMAGQAVTLNWATTGAAKTEISTIGSVPPTGNSIVTPGNSMEYQLSATNSAGSTAMKVNIRVTSFATDKPELVITDFGVEGDRAYYKIKNIGAVNAKRNTTFLFIQGDHRASSLVEILPAGEERKLYFSNYTWSYGAGRTYTVAVRVCADGLNEIGEYDRNNNCLSVDW